MFHIFNRGCKILQINNCFIMQSSRMWQDNLVAIGNQENKQVHKILIVNSPLKELRNCILFIIRVWSLFCSVRVYATLHFLPILLVKLGFRLSPF